MPTDYFSQEHFSQYLNTPSQPLTIDLYRQMTEVITRMEGYSLPKPKPERKKTGFARFITSHDL